MPKSTFATIPSSLDAETRKRFKCSKPLEDIQRPGTVYEQFYIVAKFCLMKCVIFREIGDLDHCKMWLDLPLMIFQDLLEENNGLEKKTLFMGPDTEERLFCEILHTKLIIAECDTSKRSDLFNQAAMSLSSDSTIRFNESALYYLRKSIQIFKIDVDVVMPFLQHLISQSNNCYFSKKIYFMATHRSPGATKIVQDFRDQDQRREEAKKSLLAYRNSLMVINHFKSLF